MRGLQSSTAPTFPQLDGQGVKSLIKDFSSSIKYWKAIQCPCTTPETGQPKISCNVCRGLGWAYDDHEKDIRFQYAQVHSRRSQKMQKEGGSITQGSASFTFLPGVIPGEGDLVQVCADREIVNDEYHVVGTVLTDQSTAETLRFRDIICVEQVCVLNAVTQNNLFLSKDKWSFDPKSRTIRFDPIYPIGTKYSIRYQAVPEYILRQETAKPLLRVAHDDNFNSPYNVGGKFGKDVVYPFNCLATRLDRAIIERQRGAIDFRTQSTFNNSQGRGPFR